MTPEEILHRIVDEDSRQARAMLAIEYEKVLGRLLDLCERLVEINPEGRKAEWWQTMDDIARIVENNRSEPPSS